MVHDIWTLDIVRLRFKRSMTAFQCALETCASVGLALNSLRWDVGMVSACDSFRNSVKYELKWMKERAKNTKYAIDSWDTFVQVWDEVKKDASVEQNFRVYAVRRRLQARGLDPSHFPNSPSNDTLLRYEERLAQYEEKRDAWEQVLLEMEPIFEAETKKPSGSKRFGLLEPKFVKPSNTSRNLCQTHKTALCYLRRIRWC
eukprot:GABV01001870.1.p1 GENE.GABV01001870.1~~GABV01001870.1.p1  ORF type:complete len:224 (+),score=60.09 GABV01001870.1:72-674(+)